jgi:hypothetical protein
LLNIIFLKNYDGRIRRERVKKSLAVFSTGFIFIPADLLL